MITLINFKKYLKISWDAEDDQLNLAISNAKGFLKWYLWYSLELNASKVANFCWKYSSSFELPFININSVSTIKHWEDEFDDSLETYAWSNRVYNERGLVRLKDAIGPFVEITYSFWFDDASCPEDLKVALYEIAANQYKSMWKVSLWDIKSESVDWDQIVFKDLVWELSPKTVSILNNYKMYEFSA